METRLLEIANHVDKVHLLCKIALVLWKIASYIKKDILKFKWLLKLYFV